MTTEYVPVRFAANHFACDFERCDNAPVGWTRLRKYNRSLGGYLSAEVYMVCADHIMSGEPVYPRQERSAPDDGDTK